MFSFCFLCQTELIRPLHYQPLNIPNHSFIIATKNIKLMWRTQLALYLSQAFREMETQHFPPSGVTSLDPNLHRAQTKLLVLTELQHYNVYIVWHLCLNHLNRFDNYVHLQRKVIWHKALLSWHQPCETDLTINAVVWITFLLLGGLSISLCVQSLLSHSEVLHIIQRSWMMDEGSRFISRNDRF